MFEPEDIQKFAKNLQERTELIKMSGGISLENALEEGLVVPKGFWLDRYSLCFVPPNLRLPDLLEPPRGVGIDEEQ